MGRGGGLRQGRACRVAATEAAQAHANASRGPRGAQVASRTFLACPWCVRACTGYPAHGRQPSSRRAVVAGASAAHGALASPRVRRAASSAATVPQARVGTGIFIVLITAARALFTAAAYAALASFRTLKAPHAARVGVGA